VTLLQVDGPRIVLSGYEHMPCMVSKPGLVAQAWLNLLTTESLCREWALLQIADKRLPEHFYPTGEQAAAAI
jgi:hypothetical protein